MLTVIKGPLCSEDIRTVNNILYPTFRDACEASGFLADDNEYIEAITEAKDWGYGHFLRKLFVTMLVCDSLNKPDQVWEKTWHWLSDGILHREKITAANPGIFNILTKVIFSFNTKIHVSNSDIIYAELQLSNDSFKNLTLSEIEDLLQKNRSLKQFPSMPYPDAFATTNCGNRLIYSELDYNMVEQHNVFQRNYNSMTGE